MPVLSRSLIEGRIAHQAETWGNEAIAIHEALWNGTEFAPKDLLRPAGRDTRFLRKARPPRPSEPILIPKLRIQFADFPYLHYSIDQRLLTLETCCGYGYELVRHRRVPQSDFQGSAGHSWTQRELLRSSPESKPILPARGFQGLDGLYRKDNSSQSSGGRLRLISCCHVGYEGPNGSATRLRNKDLIPFWLRLWFSL